MAQYVEPTLNYGRVSGRKPVSERIRMLPEAAPRVYSDEKANEKTRAWEEEMKERLGGWWW